VLKLSDGAEIGCRALLIATGIAFRKLDVPGLDRLTGAGVYYYAPMSEAFSYRDGSIYIVGGANSAGQAAMYFSKFARHVTMLVRGNSCPIRCRNIWKTRLLPQRISRFG
jgi:thioredoxin reductase (NADPH)